MRLKVIITLFGVICGVLPMAPAASVYGGTQASGTPLVLTLLTSKTARTSFCSMALLTERIVVTAAHCVIEDQGVAPNLRWDISNIYVSQPGADVTKDDLDTRVRVLKVVTRDDFINTWKPEIKDYRTQIHDIAFLFLEKPLVKDYKIEIATDQEINAAISRADLVTHYGYGLQSPNTQNHSPWMTQLPLIERSDAHLDKSKVMYSKEGPTAMCPGDSGGPWYLDVGGVTKIAAVLVAASGCRGNLPYNGGTLGTRIAPYMDMANAKWDEFIRVEKEKLAAEQLKIETLENLRTQAIKDGTYNSAGGCHVPGIQAEIQMQSLDGTWNLLAPASGWFKSASTCPVTHSTQPWAIVKIEYGTLLRWRYWSSSFNVYGEVFKWTDPTKIDQKSTSAQSSSTTSQTSVAIKKITITCLKGKQVKKVTATKPKCPTGWTQKKK